MVNRLLVVINTAIYFNVLGNLLHCTAYAVLVFEDRSVCGPFVVKMSARPAAVKLLSPHLGLPGGEGPLHSSTHDGWAAEGHLCAVSHFSPILKISDGLLQSLLKLGGW